MTRAGVKPLDAIPTLIGTVAGLIALRFLVTRLWRMRQWPDTDSDLAAKEPDRPATSRRAFFAATGVTAAASAVAATGGRLLSAARSNVAQARESLQLPGAGETGPRSPRGSAVQGARGDAVADAQQRLLPH